MSMHKDFTTMSPEEVDEIHQIQLEIAHQSFIEKVGNQPCDSCGIPKWQDLGDHGDNRLNETHWDDYSLCYSCWYNTVGKSIYE